MLDLNRFFTNPFLDEDISRDEIVAFTADTIARFTSQNTAGLYDSTIANLDTLFAALGGRISDENVLEGVRQARTAATNIARKNLQGAISSLEGIAHARLKRKSAEYISVFPTGLAEFDAATLDQLDGKVEALLIRAADYQTALGTVETGLVEAARVAFATLRGQQLGKKAGTDTAAGLRKAADLELRAQLFQALLLAASKNANQPAQASLFFKQSLLENPLAAGDGAAAQTPP